MTLKLIKIKMRMILESLFGADTSTRKKALIIFGLAYFGIAFTVIFSGIFTVIAGPYRAAGLEWLFYGLSGAMAFGLCFIGSVFTAKNHLYNSKDNELLLALPITGAKILISRLVTIVLFNIISIVPVFIGTLVGLIVNFGFDFITVGLLIFCYMIIILSATALTSVFSWIIAFIESKIRFKNVMHLVVISILFFLYMAVMLNMNSLMDGMAEKGTAIGESIRVYGAPMFFMGKAIEGHSLTYFLYFMAMGLSLCAIVYFFMARNYVKVITTKKSGPKVKYKEKSLAVSSGFMALLKKELTRVTGTPMLLFNYGSGLMFMLIGAIYLFIKKDSLEDVVQLLSVYGVRSTSVLGRAAAFFMGFMAATVGTITASSINLEGKTLWILKTMPCDEKDILRAKLFVPSILGLPFTIISAVIVGIALKTDLLTSILMVMFPYSIMTLAAVVGLLINLTHYKFNWINESYAYKQAAAPMITSFASLGYMATFLLIYIFLISMFMDFGMYLLVVTCTQVCAIAVLYSILMNKGVRDFRKLKF